MPTFRSALTSGTTHCPLLGLHYGERTSLPLSVHSATLHVTCLANQRLCHVATELVVCNDATPGSVAATLRLPLPMGASVCGFSLETDSGLLEAIAVPKQKAAAVAYKEKEKGRQVGTTRHVSGSVWQTELYPLPRGARRRVCVAYVATLEAHADGGLGLSLPLAFEHECAVSALVHVADVAEAGGPARYDSPSTLLSCGLQLSLHEDVAAAPCAALAIAPGAEANIVHFDAYVSRALVDSLLPASAPAAVDVAGPPAAEAPIHVAVACDTSRSCASLRALWRPLLDAIDVAEVAKGRRVVYSLHAFSTDSRPEIVSAVSLPELHAAMDTLHFDGGTNLELLDSILAAAPADAPWSYILLLSDGVDCLLSRRLPSLRDARVPIHAPLPPPGHSADTGVLHWLTRQTGGSAAASVAQPGAFAAAVCAGDDTPALVRIETDLSGDLDATIDDAVCTVPDALLRLSTPIGPSGLRVSGRCDIRERVPTLLTLTLKRAGRTAQVPLPIPQEQGPGWSTWLANGETCTGSLGAAASGEAVPRLLAARYALGAIDELRIAHHDPRAAETSATSLATSYGLATDASTLLLLHTAEQFVEHELPCPEGHPAYEAWTMLKEAREAGRESAAAEQKTKDELKLSRVLNPMVKRFGYMQRNAAEIPKRAQAEAERAKKAEAERAKRAHAEAERAKAEAERAKAEAERAPAHVSSSAATPFRGGMNLFGRRPNSAAPAPTPAMGARERIVQQVELLTKREEHLQRKIDNEIRMAREFSAQKKKQEALTCIKRKKLYEKQIEQIIGAPLCT